MKNILLPILLIVLFACQSNADETLRKKSHPSHNYDYVVADSADFTYFETDYVPVYSDIYDRDGTKRFMLTTTLSLRNTSLTDSSYILQANYYDSYGKLLDNYVDSIILLSPLESIEFVVEATEGGGGAGANFIIRWAAKKYSNQLLIQSVMIGTYAQQGISFLSGATLTDSITIK